MKTIKYIASTAAIGMAMVGLSASVHALDLTLDGEINPLSSSNTQCWAYSPIGGGNTYIAGDPAVIKVQVTKSGRVNAFCHVQDNSGIYEAEAEQTKVEECGITLLDGTFVLGSGHVVAAANNGEFEGGNMRLHCHGWLPEEEPE